MDASYQTSVKTDQPAEAVFKKLAEAAQWWTNDFEGACSALGHEFIVRHPGAHYSKQQVVEVHPGKKLVWLVTESKLDWLQNQDEWTGTRMIFELTPGELRFTHEGLTPEKECYERCTQGWDMVINDKLRRFIANSR